MAHTLPSFTRSLLSQVLALDLLGFGRSDKPLLSYTLELWRDLVLDFLAKFCAGAPTVLVGNSMGSLICLNVREPSLLHAFFSYVRSSGLNETAFPMSLCWKVSVVLEHDAHSSKSLLFQPCAGRHIHGWGRSGCWMGSHI